MELVGVPQQNPRGEHQQQFSSYIRPNPLNLDQAMVICFEDIDLTVNIAPVASKFDTKSLEFARLRIDDGKGAVLRHERSAHFARAIAVRFVHCE